MKPRKIAISAPGDKPAKQIEAKVEAKTETKVDAKKAA